jgi:hypothetical protein
MREVVLPISDIKVTIEEGTGFDLINAQKMASQPEDVVPALMSLLCKFNGEKKVLEDVLKLNLTDFIFLQNEVVGNIPLGITPDGQSQ